MSVYSFLENSVAALDCNIWETVDREHSRCTRHGITWHRTADTFRVGPEVFVHGACPMCSASPLRGDIEAPNYWKPTAMGTRRDVPAMRCDHHGEVFEVDAACRTCVEEDMGRDALEEMLTRDRTVILGRIIKRSTVNSEQCDTPVAVQ